MFEKESHIHYTVWLKITWIKWKGNSSLKKRIQNRNLGSQVQFMATRGRFHGNTSWSNWDLFIWAVDGLEVTWLVNKQNKSGHIFRPPFQGVGLVEVDQSHDHPDHQIFSPVDFLLWVFLKGLFMKHLFLRSNT